MLSADEEKHIKAKVNEFLPEFMAHVRLPEQQKEFALTYAIQVLAKELANCSDVSDLEVKDGWQAMCEWLEHMNKPEPKQGERARLMEQMKKIHRKK